MASKRELALILAVQRTLPIGDDFEKRPRSLRDTVRLAPNGTHFVVAVSKSTSNIERGITNFE